MNKVIVTFLLLIGIVASSCTTSKSVISQKADLSRYEYASIINNDTYHIPAQLMEYEIQLFDAIESSRLKLVNDIRIGELSPNQQSKLLMVHRDYFRKGVIILCHDVIHLILIICVQQAIGCKVLWALQHDCPPFNPQEITFVQSHSE